ncbi:hypothetical protein Dimus_024473 [Dionaea muscipula]
MDLIKRQRWEKLFKRRELVHVDAVKEFYAKLTLSHFKQKDVVRSRVRGVEIKYDHMRLASILGIPGNNGICEDIKEVWEESKYTKPLEIIRNFANDNTIMAARRVKSVEMKPFQRYDYFEDTFLTMCKLTRENGVWWIGTGENRRRYDEIEAPAEEVREEEEAQNTDFDWEVVVDEAAVQGESGSDDLFFDSQVGVEELVAEVSAFPASPGDSTTQQKEPEAIGVDPSSPSGHIPESVMIKL